MSKMNGTYFIHCKDAWESVDLATLVSKLSTKYEQSADAAIGEGAGGAGFDVVVEFALNQPVVSGLISAALYDVAKLLIKKAPKNRPKPPKGVPASYRLVVHTSDGVIISINLDEDIDDIEKALDDIPEMEEGQIRLFQDGDDWNVY